LIIPIVVKNKDFYVTFNFLSILFAGYAFSGLRAYFWAPLVYFKKTKAFPKIFFLSAVFQIITSIVLIYYFGLIGAAWANFLVRPVQVILLYMESKKIFKYKINRWKLVFLPAIFIAVVLISELVTSNESRIFFEIGQFIVAIVMVSMVYKKEAVPLIRERLHI
jgi:O-antigen/teichoic acid export membrane protein